LYNLLLTEKNTIRIVHPIAETGLIIYPFIVSLIFKRFNENEDFHAKYEQDAGETQPGNQEDDEENKIGDILPKKLIQSKP